MYDEFQSLKVVLIIENSVRLICQALSALSSGPDKQRFGCEIVNIF